MLNLSDFDFELPEALIAKFPVSPRDHSRLLVTSRQGDALSHSHFYELPKWLKRGDVLVLNRTRVIKARLFASDGKKRPFEVLLLGRSEESAAWNCLVRPGKRVAPEGTTLYWDDGVRARVFRKSMDERQFLLTFEGIDSKEIVHWIDRNGTMPLPPYMKRPARAEDNESYQTVYAGHGESVAAPTAGLHFTQEGLGTLKAQGVQFEHLELEIGYGTFAPLDPSATQLHKEQYVIAEPTWERLQSARREGRRVIAVGTTSLRALESAALSERLQGDTTLFIRPGFPFKAVDGLVTNFHLPQSSLFILICAFMGSVERAKKAYLTAISHQYRFFSYGDAMLIA
jgi:S-adenosylmethionine:tRNA ribosyltransferase-isomerase